MKSVVLSTTVAEYVAVLEVVKEIKFSYQMLRSTEIVQYGWQIKVVCQRGKAC